MPPAKEFCHLHFHTEYSLLDGACKIKDAVQKAVDTGMRGLAISDHGVLYGAIAFYSACQSAGIKPIIGCEMYVSDNNMRERKRNEDGSQSNHLLLLARNATGYANLMRLSSAAHLEGFYYKPRIDKEFLAQHSEGLIGTTGCLAAEVPRLITRGELDEARARVRLYQDILGSENFYIEYQDHGLPEQHKVNEELDRIARELEVQRVVTNDVHYIDQAHAEAHEVMLCLQTRTTMNDPNRLKYGSDQFYMKTADEMWERWGADYADALTNTVAICDSIELDLKLNSKIHFPEFPLPEGSDVETYLREQIRIGIARCYDISDFMRDTSELSQTIRDRIDMEIGVIRMKGFLNYFIVVADFVNWARQNGVPVGPGRGSGAGSLVAYALNITTVDPLKYNLLFERFLNPERDSPPDFDIDFCQANRGKVIDYVKEKYGAENCANIITFGTLGAKTVIRDIGRVLEIPLPECDRLAKMVPETPGMTLAKAEEQNPEFRAVIRNDDNAREIMKFARVLEGLPRNPGVHAAGVVMGENRLTEIVPLSRDKDGNPITQYEMSTVEQTGLLKMDFLGLKTLTVIAEAAKNIELTTGKKIDPETDIPLHDTQVFELMARGDTIGVFQVESSGMQEMLRKFKPKKFEDVIALIALYRPGPMAILDDYIARSHGEVAVTYDHPLLEDILEETYGYMVYQEQVQQAANVLAGYSLAEGDILRRAMGKKKASVMAEQRIKFVDGCKAHNDITPKLAGKIFDDIEAFAGYGFNKSHSAAYAVITMQTGWLKAYYPVEFMAALCSCEMSNPDKLSFFIGECQSMGLEVRPPNVNESIDRFRPEKGGIRFGLAGIKMVGQGAVEALIEEREASGPFESLSNFASRVSTHLANKKCLESLVKCGAFDFTGLNRRSMFEAAEMVMLRAAADQRDREQGQMSLFDLLEPDSEAAGSADDFPVLDPWPEQERLAQEKDLVGFYITGHPLHQHAWDIKTYALKQPEEIKEIDPGQQTRTAGLVTGYRKLFTRKNQEPMCAFSLEGLGGICDVVVFPEAYRTCGRHIQPDALLMVAGEVSEEEGKIFGQEIMPLGRAWESYCTSLELELKESELTDELVMGLKQAVTDHPGNIPMRMQVQMEDGHRVQILPEARLNVAASQPLIERLRQLLGESRICSTRLETAVKRPLQRKFGRQPA